MDSTDDNILKILQEDARTSFLDISKKIRVSESTVRNRVKNLKEQGIIQKYAAVVNPSKIGYNSVAYVGIDVMPEKFLSVAKKLCEFDQIKAVSTCTGDHTIMTEIWMHTGHDLRSFISEKIESMEGVTRTCPAIVSENLKNSV